LEISIAFAGRGGQGLVFAATLLANTLFKQGYYVAQLQSYGAEVRGGSVLAYVVASDMPIENPFVDSFTLFIALHEAGVKRWLKLAQQSSIVILNRDLVETKTFPNTIVLPITRKVEEAGARGRENIAALGILAALGVARNELLIEVLRRQKEFEKNRIAYKAGYALGLEISSRVERLLRSQGEGPWLKT